MPHEKTIPQRERELQKQKQEAVDEVIDDQAENNRLSLHTYLTGVSKAKVIDFNYNGTTSTNSTLTLTVQFPNNDVTDVKVSDTGGYSVDNELVRLIKATDIKNQQFGDLIGKEILLKIDGELTNELRDYRLKEPPQNHDWSIYTPDSFDIIGKNKFRIGRLLRYGAYQTVSQFVRTYLVGVFMTYMGMMTVVATALLMILDIYNSSFSTFSGLFFLMAVSPLLVPLVFHISTAI